MAFQRTAALRVVCYEWRIACCSNELFVSEPPLVDVDGQSRWLDAADAWTAVAGSLDPFARYSIAWLVRFGAGEGGGVSLGTVAITFSRWAVTVV